jgi:hypothetical protein
MKAQGAGVLDILKIKGGIAPTKPVKKPKVGPRRTR